MIDLDSPWTKQDELYCQIGFLFCSYQLTYVEFRKMLAFLEIPHRYVYPTERLLNPILVDSAYSFHKSSGKALIAFAILGSFVDTHFSEKEQQRITTLLIEKTATGRKNHRISVL